MTAAELLAFARGPALQASLTVLILGSLWRAAAIWRLGAAPDLSEPRSTRLAAGAMRGIFGRMVPRKDIQRGNWPGALNGYLYHVGLAVIAFGYLPHVSFIERLTGLSWPALPGPVVYVAVGVTFVALFFALMERVTDPVRRLLSGFDDYFSWFVVILPCTTGMLAIQVSYLAGAAPAAALDPLPLALHLLSAELLFIWLPFGKLAHTFLVFASRGVTGAALERKGAAQ